MGRPKKVVPVVGTIPNPTPACVSQEKPLQKTPYVLELALGNETIVSKGDTMLDALKAMTLPTKVTTKTFVTVSHGDLKKKLFFTPAKVKRLFYPFSHVATAKLLALGLK